MSNVECNLGQSDCLNGPSSWQMRIVAISVTILAAAPAAAFSLGGARPAASCGRHAVHPVADVGKGALGGAVLGGLLAGPFGAMWGAQIGSSMGADAEMRRRAEQQLQRVGVSKDELRGAASLAAEVAEAEEGLRMARSAVESMQELERTMTSAAGDARSRAEMALRSGDEAAARTHLEEKQRLTRRAKDAEAEVVAAKSREASMAASVAALAKRARGVEESIRERVERGGGAGAVEAESFALEIDDPLLKKFEELERD